MAQTKDADMNKKPLTTIVTCLLRGVLLIILLFIAINLIRLAQGQPQNSNSFHTPRNDLGNTANARTIVRVHDNVERTQIASPQQNYSATSIRAPSGTICGVESRAAHGQVAPNTNGGTLNPVAFINPTTVNASGRVAFNSQVNGSDR